MFVAVLMLLSSAHAGQPVNVTVRTFEIDGGRPATNCSSGDEFIEYFVSGKCYSDNHDPSQPTSQRYVCGKGQAEWYYHTGLYCAGYLDTQRNYTLGKCETPPNDFPVFVTCR